MKTTNSQKCAFFDCARFWQVENDFGEIGADFAREDDGRESHGCPPTPV